jgi:hypothetical protein
MKQVNRRSCDIEGFIRSAAFMYFHEALKEERSQKLKPCK